MKAHESRKIVHCLSGGLDSVTLLHSLHHADDIVHCALFDYKQRHIQELEFAKLHCHRLRIPFSIIELPRLCGSQLTDDSGGWVVPNRNAVMLSVACNLAASKAFELVTFAANSGDAADFPDCRRRFVDAFNETLFQAGLSVRVQAPFITWNKAKIARHASDMGIKLREIWTCYKGGEKPCGECPACQKLEAAVT